MPVTQDLFASALADYQAFSPLHTATSTAVQGLADAQVATMIDLFSGAGGLSLGFTQAGFKSVFAVEIDKTAAATYAHNFGHHIFAGPIQDVQSKDIPSADIVIGGPPCQGFSPLGKMTSVHGHGTMNQLWREYLRVVKASNPKIFVIENVPELLRSEELPSIIEEATALGYKTVSGILAAVDFGVPQKRRRAFIIGVRNDLDIEPSLPVGRATPKTVRDAIEDLPLDPTGLSWHIGRTATPKSLERYKVVPPGGNRFDLVRNRPDLAPECWKKKKTGSTDVFGRLEWDKPALTIRTEFYKPEKGCYLHPQAHRPLTHREAARLQTFPDSFEFLGSKIDVAKQIGNAVPPVLAMAVALHVQALLASRVALNEFPYNSGGEA